MMTERKYEPRLNGWDDEKIYYFDENGVTWCVNDYPELFAKMIEMCREYFRQAASRAVAGGEVR